MSKFPLQLPHSALNEQLRQFHRLYILRGREGMAELRNVKYQLLKFTQIATVYSPRLFTPTCQFFYTDISVISVTFRNSGEWDLHVAIINHHQSSIVINHKMQKQLQWFHLNIDEKRGVLCFIFVSHHLSKKHTAEIFHEMEDLL